MVRIMTGLGIHWNMQLVLLAESLHQGIIAHAGHVRAPCLPGCSELRRVGGSRTCAARTAA